MINISIVIRFVVATLGILAPLVAVPWMLRSSSGAVGPLILIVGAGCAVLALINPRIGLYIAAFLVIYLDYFKKIAVYYGEVSMLTIIQVLSVSMVTIGAVYAGVILQAALKRIYLRPMDFLLFAGMAAFSLIAFVISYAGTRSVAQAGQFAANLSIYAGLIAVMPKLLSDDEHLLHFFKFVILCFVPWTVMGLKQYFLGFGPMDWFYAETYLSPVTSWQFFVDLQMYGFPRTIGFGSGSVNYGAIGFMLPLALWIWLHTPTRKFLWGFAAIALFVGMLVSLQRFATILPLVGIAFFFFTQSWKRLAIAYGSTITLLLVCIVFSEFLADRLMDINDAIASDGKWAGAFLRVGTFGSRLNGWELLRDPDTYSLFGRFGEGELGNFQGRAGDRYHDSINVLLEAFGVFGLLVAVSLAAFTGYKLHSTIFSIQDPARRSLANMLIAAIVPIFFGGMLGGSNFHTNPFNFIMWMHIGGIYCLLRFDREMVSQMKHSSADTPDDSLYAPDPIGELARSHHPIGIYGLGHASTGTS